MEAGMSEAAGEEAFEAYARRLLQIPDFDLRSYSPLTLAFLGDAVYELVIRTMVVTRANTSPNQLNRQSSALVKASSQAEMMHAVAGLLSEEEQAVYRRGRNSHTAAVPKGASIGEYHAATALESLFGWLYLQGRTDRLNELFEAMMEEAAHAI